MQMTKRLAEVLSISTIRTVFINVSRSVDCLGRVQGVLAPPRLMVPAVVMMPVRVVVGARITVDVRHNFVRSDQVPIMCY